MNNHAEPASVPSDEDLRGLLMELVGYAERPDLQLRAYRQLARFGTRPAAEPTQAGEPFGYWCKFQDGSEDFLKRLPAHPDDGDVPTIAMALYATPTPAEPAKTEAPTNQTEWDRVYGLIRYWAARARKAEAALSTPATPACPHCNGSREVFTHAEDCTDDLCALNGDMHSCAGRIEPCECTPPTPEAEPISRAEWIAAAKQVYLDAGDSEADATECARWLCNQQDWLGQEVGDPGEEAQEDVQCRPRPVSTPEAEPAQQDTKEPGPGDKVAALPFAILDDELAALHRFYETTEDGQDYDVPAPMMKRLAVIGLVRRVTGNRYEFTDFGLSVRNGDFATPPAEKQAAPSGEDFPYDRTFRAIQAATKLENGGTAIGVSVIAFRKAWNSYATPAPQDTKGADRG